VRGDADRVDARLTPEISEAIANEGPKRGGVEVWVRPILPHRIRQEPQRRFSSASGIHQGDFRVGLADIDNRNRAHGIVPPGSTRVFPS
jgi:hypothetical protein